MIKHRDTRRSTLLACVLGLTACAGTPSHDSPALPPAPPAWQHGSVASAPACWTLVEADPALQHLIEQAFTGNPDLARRLRQLKAARLNNSISANAQRLAPTIGASGNARSQLTGQSGSTSVLVDGYAVDVNQARVAQSYSLSTSASYEIDVWDRLTKGRAQEAAQLESQALDLQGQRLVLAGDIATTYYALALLDARRPLDVEQLDNARAALAVTAARVQAGQALPSDLARSQAALTQALAQEQARQLERADRVYDLALALGADPASYRFDGAALPEGPPPAIASHLPSDVLAGRPDLARARIDVEMRMRELKLGKTAWLPGFMIDLSGGSSGARVRQLGIHPLLLGLSASMEMFDWKGREVRLQTTQLALDDALASLDASYARALVEIERAFAARATRMDELARAETALAQARERERLAQLRHGIGGEARQVVRDAAGERADATLALYQARAAQLQAQLALYKVLAIPVLRPAPVAPAG